MGLSALLDIGKQGVLSHQASINVAGHNIANAGTPGYSRQEAVLTPAASHTTPAGMLGGGVRVETIRRNYDSFLESRLINALSVYGGAETYEKSISDVELLFNAETGNGLSEKIDSFFGAINDLADNPEGYLERSSLKSRAEVMIDSFGGLSAGLKAVRNGIDVQLKSLVDDVNGAASQIAVLNGRIAEMESGNNVANDLRDQRSRLVLRLSEKVDINAIEGADGRLSIYGKGGFIIVQGVKSYDLALKPNAANKGHLDIYSQGAAGGGANITSRVNGGSIGGALKARDDEIKGYIDRIDNLAYGIATEINGIHESGFALDGVTTGIGFFSALDGSEGAAELIGLSED